MSRPKGSLTGPQLEIMKVLWSHGSTAFPISEIWHRLPRRHEIARTTVQTMVNRLEQRGWLAREVDGGVHRYRPTCDEAETTKRLASEFVSEFFDGSAARLVSSLLGSEGLSPEDLKQLREMLDAAEDKNSQTGENDE